MTNTYGVDVKYVAQVNFRLSPRVREFSTIGEDGKNNFDWRIETHWEDNTNKVWLVKMYLLQKDATAIVKYKVVRIADNLTMIDWTDLSGFGPEFGFRVPIASREKRGRNIMLQIATKGKTTKYDQSSIKKADLDFFNNKEFSDVVVKCGDERFECHKVFLATKSPVFKAMLTSNMKETNNNEIQIDDIEPEVMTEFLKFIYTGKSSNLDKFAMDLFIAADKYQINSLKEICEEALISSLEIDNCLSLLLVGDKCSTVIKKSAITFMINNKSSINLDEVLLDHPSLMLEILKEDFGK